MKSKQRVKVQHGILTLMFMLGLLLGMSATVWADESVPYLAWDADRQKVVEVEGGCTSYTEVTSSTTILENGWYVVPDGEMTINDRICVKGTIHLILCDGAKLTASKGITVNNSNALNIYGQSKGTGMLVAAGFEHYDSDTKYTYHYPGIGSDYYANSLAAGDIIIHGGTVTAQGTRYSPGIGGFCEKWEEPVGIKYHGADGGNVMIYHGIVAASSTYQASANAIGKGSFGKSDGDLTLGKGVKLYGNSSKMPEGVGDTGLLATGNGGVYSGKRDRYMKTVPPHTHTTGSAEITFQPWTDANLLPGTAGNYYLTQDVTLSGSWNVPDGTTNLCLNGYGIIGSNENVILNTATLNLYDCNSTNQTHYFSVDSTGLAKVNDAEQEGAKTFTGGYITGGTAAASFGFIGGGVYVYNNGIFSMYGGTIIGNQGEYAGGVYVSGNQDEHAEFNLIDGSISFNKANCSGGGVDVYRDAKGFNMSGGSITNNTAGKDGGGINLRIGSKFNMTGGSITDNTANGNENGDGGGIWVSESVGSCNISGDAKITGNKTAGAERNVYLAYNTDTSATRKINVDRALTDNAAIGVTLGTADGTGVFTEGLSGKLPTGKTPADIFTSDDTGYSVTATTDGEAQLIKKPQPKPEPKPEPKINKAAAKIALDAGIIAKSSGSKVTASWGAVKGASSYVIYANYCGQKKCKKIKTVSGKTTSFDITKLAGKKLNTKKNLKLYIVAYQTVKGKKVKVAKSILVHAPGSKNSKRTNVTGVKVKKASFKLKKGKTAKIKAKLVLEKKSRKPLKHEAKFRYATSNTKVAKVNKKGKITAVGKGKCTVYVYAVSGVSKKIKVTVK